MGTVDTDQPQIVIDWLLAHQLLEIGNYSSGTADEKFQMNSHIPAKYERNGSVAKEGEQQILVNPGIQGLNGNHQVIANLEKQDEGKKYDTTDKMAGKNHSPATGKGYQPIAELEKFALQGKGKKNRPHGDDEKTIGSPGSF